MINVTRTLHKPLFPLIYWDKYTFVHIWTYIRLDVVKEVSMSREGRGVFQMIFKSFVASIKLGSNKPKLIGEDYYGTKYYETPISKNSAKRFPARHFEPINKTDFEQEIPAEWEAWLRHRRKFPPTKEELEKNYQMQLIKKQNARQIKETYSSTETEVTKLGSQTQQQSSFPTYEEYKNQGKDYQIKISKEE